MGLRNVVYLADANTTHTFKWVDAISTHQYNVHLICFAEPTIQYPSNINVIPLNISKSTSSRLSALTKVSYVFKVFQVRRILRNINPIFIHAHYATSYGLIALLGSREIPYIISLWGSDILDFPNRNFIFKWLLGKILKNATVVCSTSKYMAEASHQLYSINPVVVPFGIDTSIFTPRPKIKMNIEKLEILNLLIVKSLEHVYGIDIALKALSICIIENPTINIQLTIAGSGTMEKEYKVLSQELNVSDHVKFIGRVEHSAVSELLSHADIFLNLSRRESFGVSVLEASSCGTPVIVSDIDGLKEVYVEGSTGLSCKVDDPMDTARKILSLAKNNDLRESLGTNGREFVTSKYQWKNCVHKMLSIYDEIA